MLSRSRSLCSLAVALFLSTLALADSAPVSIAYLHSSTGAYASAQSYSDHSSISQRSGTPMILAAFNSPSREKPDARLNAPLFGNGSIQVHGTVSRKNGDWGCVAHARDHRPRSVSYARTGQPDAAFNRPHRDSRSSAAKVAPRLNFRIGIRLRDSGFLVSIRLPLSAKI